MRYVKAVRVILLSTSLGKTSRRGCLRHRLRRRRLRRRRRRLFVSPCH